MNQEKNWPLRAALAVASLGLLLKEGVQFAPRAAKQTALATLAIIGGLVFMTALGAGILIALNDGSDVMVTIEPQDASRWLAVGSALESKTLNMAASRAAQSDKPAMVLLGGAVLQALKAREEPEAEKREAQQLQEAKAFIGAIKEGASVEEAAAKLRAGSRIKQAPSLMAWANAQARAAPLASPTFVEVFISGMPGHRGERDQALSEAGGEASVFVGILALLALALAGLLGVFGWSASKNARHRVARAVEARREEIESAVQAKALARVARKGKPAKQSGRL